MTDLNLSEWAAVAEILGMVTVIISLLLVVRSISQNTAAMHTANGNFIYLSKSLSKMALSQWKSENTHVPHC